ncbi:MAG TPA: hypothetical protein VNR18_13840 [Hyphomicrobiales bacterium]|nr:hypothetical protein [Hyphomicrobiales bacterium]
MAREEARGRQEREDINETRDDRDEQLIPVEEFARIKGMTILEVIDHIVNDGGTYRGRQDGRGKWLVDRRSPREQWWRQ